MKRAVLFGVSGVILVALVVYLLIVAETTRQASEAALNAMATDRAGVEMTATNAAVRTMAEVARRTQATPIPTSTTDATAAAAISATGAWIATMQQSARDALTATAAKR